MAQSAEGDRLDSQSGKENAGRGVLMAPVRSLVRRYDLFCFVGRFDEDRDMHTPRSRSCSPALAGATGGGMGIKESVDPWWAAFQMSKNRTCGFENKELRAAKEQIYDSTSMRYLASANSGTQEVDSRFPGAGGKKGSGVTVYWVLNFHLG